MGVREVRNSPRECARVFAHARTHQCARAMTRAHARQAIPATNGDGTIDAGNVAFVCR